MYVHVCVVPFCFFYCYLNDVCSAHYLKVRFRICARFVQKGHAFSKIVQEDSLDAIRKLELAAAKPK